MIDLPCTSVSDVAFEIEGAAPAQIRVCRLTFDRHPHRIEFEVGSYTNKALVQLEDREPLFGELAILRLAEQQGFEGVWLDRYHQGRMWRTLPDQGDPVAIPCERQDLLDRIRARHGKAGGAWDVFVWRGDEIGFLESKGPGDQVRQSQRDWLEAALAEGIPPQAFTLVEWTVTGESPGRRRSERCARFRDGRRVVRQPRVQAGDAQIAEITWPPGGGNGMRPLI